MAIGRISGSVLKSNLTRNGVDLAFETNLLYLDVTNNRIGIGTSEPTTALHVNGTLTSTALNVDNITIDGNTISSTNTNGNIVLGPNGSGIIETNASIIPQTDLSVSLGSVTKRFTDAYFGSGTVYIGDNSISSSNEGLVFSAPISVEGGLTQISDDSTAIVINATKIGNSATTVNNFDTADYDSALYYTTTLDESNNKIEVAKISLCHDTASSYITKSGIATSDTNSVHTYSTDISGGVRLQLTGTSAVNSMTAYRLSLGDNSTAGTGGHTAVVTPSTISGSSTTSIDSWSASTYRSVKYFISVKNTGTNEVNNIEAIVLYTAASADIVNYNIVKTGNEELCTLSAGYDSGNVHLYAVPNNSQTLRVMIHKISLADSESVVNYDNVYVLPTKTISGSSYTTIDTFENTKINSAVYFVTSTNTTDGLYTASEVYVTTDGTESFVVHGPELAVGGRIYFQTSLSGNKVNLKAHTTGSSNTVINAYRIGMYRFEQGGDFAQTVTLDTTQTITGAKTFSNAVVMGTSEPSTALQVNGTITATTVAGATDLNLSAATNSDINIPANIGLTFGDDGEKIEGDGTDLTIASGGDIIIDADNADVVLKDGGTEFGRFSRVSSDFVIKSATSDKDLVFKGNDGGSTITALTLDMSEAGAATFNSTIATGQLTLSGNTLSTNTSNANLELNASGIGKIELLTDTNITGTLTSTDLDVATSISTTNITATNITSTHSTHADGTVSLTSSSTGVVDSFTASTYRSAKYSVSMWDSTNSRAGIQEFYVTHDGSSAYISTTTGITSTGTDMATFTADIDSGNVRVLATLASSDGTTALAASSGDSIQQSPSTSTTLSADIDDSQNYIPVVSTTDFSTSVVAEIETTNEVVSFTDISENNFTYSQDLTNWHSNSNVTVTSNATTAPDGTLTADSVQTITTGSTSYVRNNTFGVTTQSTPLTLSFYVKGTGFIQLSTNTFWVGNGYTNVNCATGETYAPTNFSGITSSDVGNGWWRIQMSAPHQRPIKSTVDK
jgi:hypothetical protein